MSKQDDSERILAVASDATLGWGLEQEALDDTVAVRSVVSGVSGLPALSFGVAVPGQGAAERGHDLEVLGELGRGGMGVVLHARQHSLNREVAIKCVTPKHRNTMQARALLFEAQITGSLEHPNIVPVHALGTDAEGGPSMVMKRITGVEWHTLIHEPEHALWDQLPGDRLSFHLETLVQVCHAAAYAHARGILHRDIKPSNVMVGSFGEVVLLDWGVALRWETEENVGPPLAIVGTPAYMAPEMTAGGPYDRRTDIYLLGATLHELLTGDAPHDGAKLEDVLRSAAAAGAPSLGPAVPQELASITTRAMEAMPEDRFSTVEELRKALERYLQHRSSNVLVTQSLSILERLEDAALHKGVVDEAELTTLRQNYAECRFGLRHALLAWSDNPKANDGLERCVLAAATIELTQGNADSAEALLDELDEPGEAMLELLHALREDRTHEQQRIASLEREARERDAGVSSHRRGVVFMALTATIVAVMGVVEVWLRVYGHEPTHLETVLANVGLCLIVLIAYPVYNKRVEKTRHNLTVIKIVLLYTSFTVLLRFVGWQLGMTIPGILTIEALTCAFACSLLAVTFDKQFTAPATLAAMGTALALVYPALALESLVLVELGAMLWLGGVSYLRPNTS
jgi:tRNA A-37 threonylcarbamoyl transferase component Bud32